MQKLATACAQLMDSDAYEAGVSIFSLPAFSTASAAAVPAILERLLRLTSKAEAMLQLLVPEISDKVDLELIFGICWDGIAELSPAVTKPRSARPTK